jgi:predicted amidohydrolase YtcJ
VAATLAIVGANVRTMDPDRPFAEAVAVTDGVITAVGSDAVVREQCDARTQVVEAAGWTLTPGITDGHLHLLYAAELGRGIDFDRVANLDVVRAKLAAARDGVPPGEWISGYGLEYSAFGGRAFHHTIFDEVTGPHPVLVHALDLHTAFANGEALRRAGITGPREFLDGSQIVCDDTGRPTGELRERSAVQVVVDAMPEPTPGQLRAGYVDAIGRLNRAGITAIHQMDSDPETISVFADLDTAGELSLRAAIHTVFAPESEPEYVEAVLAEGAQHGHNWRADGIKFWLDGVIETGTAWLEHGDSEGRGTSARWPSFEHYARLVRRSHAAGFRIATHAIGDRAVRETLDVYQSLPDAAGRHRIEHIETAPDETLARFRPLGVTASIQPIHLRWLKPDLTDPWSQRLDHQQCAHAMRSGDLTAAGANVVLGSDWPVAPYDPRVGLFAAQLRRSPDAEDPRPIGASKPLTALQALAGYTVNAARAVGEAGVAGMLRAGYRADITGWGEDPVSCSPQDVLDVPVQLTVVDGVIRHRAQ